MIPKDKEDNENEGNESPGKDDNTFPAFPKSGESIYIEDSDSEFPDFPQSDESTKPGGF